MERNEYGLSPLFDRNSQGTVNGNCNGGANNCNSSGLQLAMVYSPMQCFRMLYTPDDALMHGTLFEELYKPLEELM